MKFIMIVIFGLINAISFADQPSSMFQVPLGGKNGFATSQNGHVNYNRKFVRPIRTINHLRQRRFR